MSLWFLSVNPVFFNQLRFFCTITPKFENALPPPPLFWFLTSMVTLFLPAPVYNYNDVHLRWRTTSLRKRANFDGHYFPICTSNIQLWPIRIPLMSTYISRPIQRNYSKFHLLNYISVQFFKSLSDSQNSQCVWPFYLFSLVIYVVCLGTCTGCRCRDYLPGWLDSPLRRQSVKIW